MLFSFFNILILSVILRPPEEESRTEDRTYLSISEERFVDAALMRTKGLLGVKFTFSFQSIQKRSIEERSGI